MFRQKDLERRCVAEIARLRGGIPRDPRHGEAWPDGWIEEEAGHRIAVEVTSAFPDRDGTAWARAWSRGERRAREIEKRRGRPVSWGVHDGQEFVLDGETEMPLVTRPTDPTAGILPAIIKKASKYGVEPPILVVYHVEQVSRLDDGVLRRIADHATAIRAPFREIWIVDEYGGPAQRVPFDGGTTSIR